jgi:hypothetical protein
MHYRYRYSEYKYMLLLGIFAATVLASCKKLVQVSAPATSLNSENVYSTDATAIAAVTAIYAIMSNGSPYTPTILGISSVAGLSADELTLYSGAANPPLSLYYTNNLNNNMQFDFWTQIYSTVYLVNGAMEGLNSSRSLTPAVKQQLLGEVAFDRAFCYFYLTSLYGDVPLVLTSNSANNAILARTPQAEVWTQIIGDLHNAVASLSPIYVDATLLNATPQRVRPTKWAALALLGRAYLYNGNWTGADSAATAVIGNSGLYSLDSPDSVFLMNSNEAIWQLQPVLQGYDVPDVYAFILPATGPNSTPNKVYLNESLVTTFEPNDLRRQDWVDSIIVGGTTYYYPYKYKNDSVNGPITEYETVLRLGEQYLIRAEAEAYSSIGTAAAIADLDTIRSRAGLPPYSGATDQTSVLNAIFHERRVELFTEWGHRWLDLKRTNTANTVMGADGACMAKGGTWNTNAQLYPVPLYDLQTDPNLVQNAGY